VSVCGLAVFEPRDADDLSSASFFTAPYPTFAAMRANDPVYRQPETGIRFLTRYEDVLELCRHPLGSARRSELFFPADAPQIAEESETVRRFLAPWMVFPDPPQHTRIRSVTTRFFTPRAIENLRPFVPRTVDGVVPVAQPLEGLRRVAGVAGRSLHRQAVKGSDRGRKPFERAGPRGYYQPHVLKTA
jgi:cytochrome P450